MSASGAMDDTAVGYAGPKLGFRSEVALASSRALAGLSRRLGLGGGSVIGGRAGLLVAPNLLAELSRGRKIVLVSGTNGKTTTTRLLAVALSGGERVVSSRSGSNLPAGIVAALAGSAPGTTGVLEVDEAYLPGVAAESAARLAVLLNLSRDQLDRTSEVRMMARRWRAWLEGPDAPALVANGDDPLVVYAASAAGRVTWVGTGLGWRSDAAGCPVCGGLVEVGEDGWGCRCGFERPALGWWVDGEELVCADGRRFRLDLAIPGGFNRANAAMAAVAASELGVELPGALERMAVVDQVEGRFQRVDVGGTSLELMLAKNPAGWAELLDLVVGDDRPIAIGINAEVADGRDPSWLWDVAFERLEGRRVIATGARCLDLGVRLLYAGVEHAVIPDQVAALSRLEARDAVFIGNYTAFQQLRRSLASRHAGPRLMPGSLRRGFSRTRSPLPGEPPEMHPHRPSWTGCPASQPIEVPATASRESTGSARPAIHGRAGGESRLRVVVVYPELLGTYGDTGNGIVLAARALWREMGAELVMARFDDPLPLSGDVYCIGGGEDGPQAEAAGHLGALAGPLERGAVVLAVCAGLQIIGTDFSDPTGRRLAGAGLVDASTDRPMTRRAVGEILSEGIPAGLGLLSGFENHAGATELGTGVSPLARVLRGTGNSERARVDGVLTRSIVGTYMHGPVLARNPRLADHLIEVATGITLPPLGPGEEGEIESLRAERVRSLQRLRRRMAFSAW